MRAETTSFRGRILAAIASIAFAISVSGVASAASVPVFDDLDLSQTPEFLPLDSGEYLGKRKLRRKRRLDGPCHTLATTRTFFEVDESHIEWSFSKWRKTLTRFSRLGFTEVIVNWTSFDGITLYESVRETDVMTPMERMVLAAREAGIQLWVGLDRPELESGAVPTARWFEDRLDKQQQRLLPLTLSLLSYDPNGAVFRGWYITDELDASLDPAIDVVFADYLESLRAMLERVQPAWPVMISASLGGANIVDETAARWAAMLHYTNVDIVLVRDGVGAGRLSIADVQDSMPILAAVLETDLRSVGVVVELFDTSTRSASSATPDPASFSRVIRQLQTARDHGREPLTVLSATEYLRNDSDRLTRRLYRRWALDHRVCRGTPRRLAGL